MNYRETPLLIPCHGDRMLGILSRPDGEQKGDSRIGVLIIVGGPQYRAGSHRQFTLLARHLAAHGIPVLRFDYRGMGDSEGEMRTFEEIDDDIRAALDAFYDVIPDMRNTALLGLCDAASAALCYAPTDRRLCGLVMLNPWVHTESSAAKILLRHYYFDRLSSRAFWQKILHGQIDLLSSLRSLVGLALRATGRGDIYKGYLSGVLSKNISTVASPHDGNPTTSDPPTCAHDTTKPSALYVRQALPVRMLSQLIAFKGRVLVVLSGRDYVAREYMDMVEKTPAWEHALAAHGTAQVFLAEADHVFSQQHWRNRVACEVVSWISNM